MEKDVKKVLISESEILKKCSELGAKITKDYEGKDLLLVGLLRGSIPFIGDLMKHINLPLEVDYMDVSSYHGTTQSSGQVKIIKDLDTPVKGLNILIVEDIIDTGRTLKTVVELFKHRGANDVKIVSLLDKPEGRVVTIEGDYIGFEIPKEFVIGYGLDYNEKYRNLPYIGVLKEEVYTK